MTKPVAEPAPEVAVLDRSKAAPGGSPPDSPFARRRTVAARLSAAFFFATVVVLGTLAVAGWFLLEPPPLLIQGEIDATQVYAASKASGRVDTLPVRRGQRVEEGEFLLSLSNPELLAKYAQTKAAAAAAAAQLAKVEAGTRPEEIEEARAGLQAAEAELALAEKQSDRAGALYARQAVAKSEYDQAATAHEAAKEKAQAARARYELAIKGARIEDINAASAAFDEAVAAAEQVRELTTELRVFAPRAGEIRDVVPRTGELVGRGMPLVAIVDLSDVWSVFHLREDLLNDFRMGTVIEATVPALGDERVDFRVDYIAPMGEYATLDATRTSGDFDRRTFEVHCRPIRPVEGLRPGMSVLVDRPQ